MSKEGKIEAIGILKSILEEESSGSESFSLASYELAILLWEAGEIGNAMHTSLTALVLDSTNKRLKRQVAIMIKEYPQLAEALVEMLGINNCLSFHRLFSVCQRCWQRSSCIIFFSCFDIERIQCHRSSNKTDEAKRGKL